MNRCALFFYGKSTCRNEQKKSNIVIISETTWAFEVLDENKMLVYGLPPPIKSPVVKGISSQNRGRVALGLEIFLPWGAIQVEPQDLSLITKGLKGGMIH